jgi:hypothetical protein
MAELVVSRQRSRRILIASLCVALQSISLLALAVFVFVVGITSIASAGAQHKATAASLSTGVVIMGGGFCLVSGLLVGLLAWRLWKQKRWDFWPIVLLESCWLLLLVALWLSSALNWIIIGEITLAVAVLASLFQLYHQPCLS